MNTIAIIGTAGRKEDAKRLNRVVYDQMYEVVLKLVKEIKLEDSPTMVISGGAAWADHLAVLLFLKGEVDKLRLYLPCDFDRFGQKFVDDGTVDWQLNPGGTSNFYHKTFSTAIGHDSLLDIADAIDDEADVVVGDGLFDRNGKIAKNASHVIALTFGSKEVLKDGGTANTMSTYLKQRAKFNLSDNSYHVDLNTMKVYKGAKVE